MEDFDYKQDFLDSEQLIAEEQMRDLEWQDSVNHSE